MTFAIIKTGGKQYKVAKGDILSVEKLTPTGASGLGAAVPFEVLLVDDGKTTKIGKEAKGAKVIASIVEEGKGPKLHIIKFKGKSNYKKKIGHRQPFTKVKIDSIK